MYFTFYFKDVIDRFEKMVGHCLCFGRRKKNTTPTNNNDDERTSIKPPHIPDSSSSGVKLTAQAKAKLESESHKAESHKAEASNAESSDAASSNAEAHKGEVQKFTYRELATATNNFRADSCIGEGGFGPVYRGQIGSTGQMIAVKKLNQKGVQGNEEFKVEIIMLSILRHPNIVNLIGYCAEGDQRLLVYEYMHLGSLEYHLHDLAPGVKPLSWNTRMKIAMGAATGLNYLHTSNPPVIYRDMKSSNILLDEEYHPKLSDLGLAKFGPTDDKTHVTTRVMGTYGYCAPEYGATGKLTVKSDIYSFGIVLLELITGRRALEKTWRGKKVLLDWARPMMSDRKDFVKLADPNLNGQFEEHMMRKVVEVALMCIREDARARPDMGEVAAALDYFVSHPYGPNSSKGERRGEQNKNSTELKELEDKSKSEREKDVAEAKMWGETWRDKKRLNAQKETDPSDRL